MFKIYVLCVLRIYRRLKRKFDKFLKFKVYIFCLFFIFALIPSIYIYIYIYVIMKTMCPSGYHHNALWQLMHLGTWCTLLLLTKPRIFNISIDCSFLSIFSSSIPHLLQMLERTNVLSQTYDILGFLNSLYFL